MSNPIQQAAQWAREIDALEHLFRYIEKANLYQEPEIQPAIVQLDARLKARRAELAALTSLYEGA